MHPTLNWHSSVHLNPAFLHLQHPEQFFLQPPLTSSWHDLAIHMGEASSHQTAMGIGSNIRQCRHKRHPMSVLWWQKNVVVKVFTYAVFLFRFYSVVYSLGLLQYLLEKRGGQRPMIANFFHPHRLEGLPWLLTFSILKIH